MTLTVICSPNLLINPVTVAFLPVSSRTLEYLLTTGESSWLSNYVADISSSFTDSDSILALAILWWNQDWRYALNQGLRLSPGSPPSRPIAETDGVPSHAPRCVKPVGGFDAFPVGFGGRSGNGLALRLVTTWNWSASLDLSGAIFDAWVESLPFLLLFDLNYLTSSPPSSDSLFH